MSILKATILAATTLVMANTAFAGVNLVPGFNVKTGTVVVKNTGVDPAGRSVVTIGCSAKGAVTCPEATAAQLAPYLIGGYPNTAAIRTGQIKAGSKFQHKINFFNSLVFAPGTYYFSVCADAGNHVVETNEGDNCKRFIKTVK